MIRVDQLIAGSLLVTLIVLSLALFDEWRTVWRQTPRWAAAGVLAAAVTALILRVFLVQPALVHGDFQGSLVVEGALGFPLPAGSRSGTYGADYGQGSFVLLGLVVSLIGRTAENMLAGNVVFSVLTIFPLAYVAARWAGRPSAGVYAAAAFSTSALVARLAHSEDSHVVGLFFATIALAYAELAGASRRKTLALVATVVAVLMVFWTRQTYYPVGTLALGVIVERQRSRFSRRALIAAGGVIVAALIFRVARTMGTSNLYAWVAGDLARRPAVAFGLVLDHPFFQVRRLSPVVALFGVGGIVALARRSPVGLTVTAHFLIWFLLTLPSGLPPEGMSWSFRLPVYALALIAVGAGGAWIEDQRPGWRTALAVGLGALGLVCTGTLRNLQPDAQFVEYRFLRDTVAQLPRPLTLIHSHDESRFPCLAVAARFHLGLADITELPAQPGPGTWIVLEGLSAHAYTMPELLNLHEEGPPGMMPDSVREFILSIFDRRTAYGMASMPRPRGMRPEFRALLSHATQIGPDGPRVRVKDVIPAGIFDVPELVLRVHRWAP